MILSWLKIRNTLLTGQLAIILVILGKLLLFPTPEKKLIPTFQFPSTVPLPQWQLISSSPLPENSIQIPDSLIANYISGYQYFYTQNNLSVAIEMRYLANTNANLKSYIKSQTGKLSPVLYENKDIGFYSLYSVQGKGYLTTCLTPYGNTVVTTDQFRKTTLLQTVNLERLFSWLTTQSKVRDYRCLWITLSVPLNSADPNSSYQTLENFWIDWHSWWRSNYPQS